MRLSLADAAREGLLETLRYWVEEQKIDINTPDEWGYSPLHHAVLEERMDAVRYLMDQGADPFLQNKWKDNPVEMVGFPTECALLVEFLMESMDLPPLHRAAAMGDTVLIRRLIKEGVDIDMKDRCENTALYHAVKNRRSEVFWQLIASGADPDCSYKGLDTEAATQGCKEILVFLMENYKYPITSETPCGHSLLHTAAQSGKISILDYLIGQRGADIFYPDYKGQSAIFYAAAGGHTHVVDYLIGLGADPEEKDEDGKTPLHAAAEHGHLPTVRYLVENQGVSADRGENSIPLLRAGNARVARYWMAQYPGWVHREDAFNATPLHFAAQKGSVESILCLVKEGGAKIDAPDSRLKTPVEYALKKGQFEALKCLIEKCGADARAVDEDGNTLLHGAAREGWAGICDYLIQDCKLSVHAQNKYGERPLHYAAEHRHGKAAVECLIFHGADIQVQDECGNTPLHRAAKSGQDRIAAFLIEGGADTQVQNIYGLDPLSDKLCKSYPKLAALKACDKDVDLHPYPLHRAAWENDPKKLRHLIETCGLPVDSRGVFGQTPLHTAIRAKPLMPAASIILLELGADPNLPDDRGETPLDLAFKYGEILLVPVINRHNFISGWEHLTEAVPGDTALHSLIRDNEEGMAIMKILSGCEDIKVKNSRGETPYYLARAFDFEKLMYWLDKFGAGER